MKKNPSIFFIVPYPTDGASNRLRVEQYLPWLDKEGIKYRIRSFSSKRFYKILYTKGQHAKKAVFFCIALFQRILDLLRAIPYDIVFIHREALPVGSILIEKIFAKMGKKIVFDFDDAIFLPSTSGINTFMDRFKNPGKISKIITLSSHIIAGNAYLAEYTKKFNDNVTVIPTAIDTERYQPSVNRNPDNKTVIGWIGSFTTRTYLSDLETVFKKIKANFPDVVFKFVGNWDGTYGRIEGVDYEEWNLDKEPADLTSFDIGIMPMPNDMWTKGKCAFKIILYMACGKPVISSPVGVNKEVIEDGKNGFLAKTAQEWFEKLEMLIKDPVLRERMGKYGRRIAEEKYSVKRLAPDFINVIRKVYSEKGNL